MGTVEGVVKFLQLIVSDFMMNLYFH